MPPHIGSWIAAGGLRGVADNTTSAVIALLSLVAVIVVIYGLGRAIAMNRRPQVVITDLVAHDGSAELSGATMLSSVVRQCVERHVNDQRVQTTRIGQTILAPASRELEPQLNVGAVETIQRAAYNSIATLSAALRAVAPENADRFLGLFSVILPPPRGISVTAVLLQRGTDAAPRVGVAVELVRLDGRPLCSTVFWEAPTSPAVASAEPGTAERILTLLDPLTRWIAVRPPVASAKPGTTERILTLLEPVARWIAVRLVVTLMVSPRHRASSHARQGLGRLLAGGLFLAAMREFPAHALAFGEQACTELEQARLLMPNMPLPITTLAGVHERMGWAHQHAGNSMESSDEFRAAVRLWQNAEHLIRDDTEGNQLKLTILVDRRLKAQLESDDPVLRRDALAQLNSVPTPAALMSNSVWLYNRSCLYAQANKADPHADYQQEALLWLGRALIRNDDTSSWNYAARDDPELAPIRGTLGPYLTYLHGLIPLDSSQPSNLDAEAFVARALAHTVGQQ